MKNKLFLSLIVASLFIYLASNLFEKKISKKENQQSFDLNIIKSGDIIFRKERNFLSDMFSNIDKSKYSHIAIALKVGENLKIYHIESNSEKDDLKIDTFEKFRELSHENINILIQNLPKKLYTVDDYNNIINNLNKKNNE